MSAAKMGAVVAYCGHDAIFNADIFRIGNCNVVRANGPISGKTLSRPIKGATHHLSDFPKAGFWRPDLGVFVVEEKQVKELKS